MWESITADSCDVCLCLPSTKRSGSRSLDDDKENIALSPSKEDLSFYGSSSPAAPACTGTSPSHCHHNIITRRTLEDHDHNSRDSGIITSFQDDGKFSTYASPTRGSFECASVSSIEDKFLEDFADIEPLEDDLPQHFDNLLTAPIVERNSPRDLVLRPMFRRALSLQSDAPPSRARSCLFTEIRPFKRPEPPPGDSPSSKKARVLEDVDEMKVPVRPLFHRAISATEESIMCAVQRSSEEPDLIGDFSKSFCLPMTPGRHQDLKSITAAILVRLIKGDFNEVSSFKVIDCRYPYEYDGGHISGAVNVYTKEQCLELLKNGPTSENIKKTSILVFHCEFSSERAPNLSRYLREQDRQLNQDTYPSLHYPEIYLLDGGYKSFYEQFSQFCVPIAYKAMLHPEHGDELRYFRSKSKTWNSDSRRGSLKRLL